MTTTETTTGPYVLEVDLHDLVDVLVEEGLKHRDESKPLSYSLSITIPLVNGRERQIVAAGTIQS